jgi:hypothetical protein
MLGDSARSAGIRETGHEIDRRDLRPDGPSGKFSSAIAIIVSRRIHREESLRTLSATFMAGIHRLKHAHSLATDFTTMIRSGRTLGR